MQCIKQIPEFSKCKKVIEGQSGLHPMKETFMLVGSISDYDEGTSKTTYAKDDTWYVSQTKSYEITVGFQGRKDSGVEEQTERLKLMLNVPPVRQLFFEEGYTYIIDEQTTRMPINLETDQYVRHLFKLKLRTHIDYEFKSPTLDAVDLVGEYVDEKGSEGELSERIPKDYKREDL